MKTERGCRDYPLRVSRPVRKSARWEYHKVSFLRGPAHELISGEEKETEPRSVQLGSSLFTPPLLPGCCLHFCSSRRYTVNFLTDFYHSLKVVA